MGSDQPLNIERGASSNETLDVEEEVAGECRVVNRLGRNTKRDGGVE
jgi:hypothetical protein